MLLSLIAFGILSSFVSSHYISLLCDSAFDDATAVTFVIVIADLGSW
jgi:hypothetical protein